MKKQKLSCLVVFFTCMLLASNALAWEDWYPSEWHDAQCHESGPSDSYGFRLSNCTSYVAFMLNVYGVPFDNSYLQPSEDYWHSASNWVSAAGNVHNGSDIIVDTYPIPGDVAWFDYGHVAWVEKVYYNSSMDPTSFEVSEYNYVPDCKFSNRSAGGSNNIIALDTAHQKFIHVLAYNEAVASLHYTDCYEMDNICDNQTHAEWTSIANRVWSQYRCTNCEAAFDTLEEAATYVGNDSDTGGGSQSYSDPSSSSSKPQLFIKEFYFGDNERTHYYTDEDIHLYTRVKNVGVDVDSDADVTLKYYRFKGEYENGDRIDMGTDNIQGSHLGHNDTKSEDVNVGVPNEEDKYQYYACIDTHDVVDESDEGDNCNSPLSIRVHERPDLAVTNLTLDGGLTSYEYGSSPFIEVTIENTGGEPFEDVPVRWYLDDVHYADDNMRHWNITNGDIKHEDVYLPDNLAISTHTIKACYDLDDDQDNSDSCMELLFEVTPALDQTLRADVDGNGTITTTDAMLIMDKSMGFDMSQTAWIESPITGDANCSGTTTTTDALLVLRKSNGLSMEGTAWCVPD